MNPDDELDEILSRIRSLSDAEKAEMLLTYFTRIIEGMDRPTLVAFRAHCMKRNMGTHEQHDGCRGD